MSVIELHLQLHFIKELIHSQLGYGNLCPVSSYRKQLSQNVLISRDL